MYSQLVHAHLLAVQKDLLWRQTFVLQENLNSSVIILSENKQSWFTFNYFHRDWQVSSLAHIWVNLKQHSSQWNNITKSTKLHNGVSMPGLYIHQLFTFKQQIPKFCQDILPYHNGYEKQHCHILGVTILPWNVYTMNWFLQAWTFPSLFYLFNIIFPQLSYIFIKNGQSS